MKKALITGITGQDGSYLAELLLSKGYEVHGLIRRASHIRGIKLHLHYGDLSDSSQLTNLIYNIKPDEIYHLGAQSHVRVSFDMPEYTGDITALGTTRILEAVRRSGIKCKFYQASSSEMYGDAPAPQNENTPFRARSPYAAAKIYSYWMVRNYQEGYTFVTRKITRAIANIVAGTQKKLYLGNLASKRDWGYAPDYVEAMWLMLQQDKPCDYVIGTGETHSVKEFLEEAFSYAGLDWKEYVEIDSRYFRPTEVELLLADSSKARKELGWSPRITFKELVKIMVDSDMELAGLESPGEGKKILKTKGITWTENHLTVG
jgi:GDPmannose 4,6-dehydratase